MNKVFHIGGFKLKDKTTQESIDKITTMLHDFKKTIPGVVNAYAGKSYGQKWPQSLSDIYQATPNPDFLDRGCNYAFIIEFTDEKACKNYYGSDSHLEFSNYIQPLLENGVESALSIDFMVS